MIIFWHNEVFFFKLNEGREDNISRSYLSKLLKKVIYLGEKLKLRTTNELSENLVIKRKDYENFIAFQRNENLFF